MRVHRSQRPVRGLGIRKKKHLHRVQNMLYTGYLVIVNGQKIKKNRVEKFPFLSCRG